MDIDRASKRSVAGDTAADRRGSEQDMTSVCPLLQLQIKSVRLFPVQKTGAAKLSHLSLFTKFRAQSSRATFSIWPQKVNTVK